jgi:hypothetical protein
LGLSGCIEQNTHLRRKHLPNADLPIYFAIIDVAEGTPEYTLVVKQHVLDDGCPLSTRTWIFQLGFGQNMGYLFNTYFAIQAPDVEHNTSLFLCNGREISADELPELFHQQTLEILLPATVILDSGLSSPVISIDDATGDTSARMLIKLAPSTPLGKVFDKVIAAYSLEGLTAFRISGKATDSGSPLTVTADQTLETIGFPNGLAHHGHPFPDNKPMCISIEFVWGCMLDLSENELLGKEGMHDVGQCHFLKTVHLFLWDAVSNRDCQLYQYVGLDAEICPEYSSVAKEVAKISILLIAARADTSGNNWKAHRDRKISTALINRFDAKFSQEECSNWLHNGPELEPVEPATPTWGGWGLSQILNPLRRFFSSSFADFFSFREKDPNFHCNIYEEQQIYEQRQFTQGDERGDSEQEGDDPEHDCPKKRKLPSSHFGFIPSGKKARMSEEPEQLTIHVASIQASFEVVVTAPGPLCISDVKGSIAKVRNCLPSEMDLFMPPQEGCLANDLLISSLGNLGPKNKIFMLPRPSTTRRFSLNLKTRGEFGCEAIDPLSEFLSSKLVRSLLSKGTVQNPEEPIGLEISAPPGPGGFGGMFEAELTIRFGFRHHDHKIAVGLIRRALHVFDSAISNQDDHHRVSQCMAFEDEYTGDAWALDDAVRSAFCRLEDKLIIEE